MTHRLKRIIVSLLTVVMMAALAAGCNAITGGGFGEKCNPSESASTGGSSTGGEELPPEVCDHSYGEWVIIKEPTCKEEGSQKRTCAACGEEQKQTLAKVGHDEVLISETPATCTTTGLKEIHCRYCDKDFSEVTPALGHDYKLKSETAAACESQGTKKYSCAREGCAAEYTEIIPATGHDYEFKSQKAPGCTEEGELVYKCKNCDGVKRIPVEANGHDFGNDGICLSCGYVSKKHAHVYNPTVVAPTCSSAGYTYYECSCGLNYKADYIEQLTHRWNDGTVVTEETCVKDGVKEYSCTREGCTAKYTEVIKAAHAWGETQTEPASCLYDGKIYKQCSRCDAEDVEIIPAGHKWEVTVVVKKAACTEKGKERRTCSVCEEFEDFEVPALGHEYKNGTCTRCGEKFIDNVTPNTEHPTYGMYFVIDDIQSAYGPNIINEYGVLLYVNEGAKLNRVAVYLTQDGNMWRRCIACTGENIEFAVYVPYLSYYEDIYYTGLNNGGINTFTLKKGADGIWRYSEYATIGVNLEDRQGNLLLSLYDIGQAGAKTRIFDNLEQMKKWLKGYDVDHVHTEVTDAGEAATCVSGGYTAGSHCSVCGEVLVERRYISALGHSYGEWKTTTEAACEKDGVRTSTCTRCNVFTTAKIPAIGHDYEETDRKEATCTQDGYVKYKCDNKNCDSGYEITLKGEHKYEIVERKAASCEVAGYVKYKCVTCESNYTEDIPAGSHEYAVISEKQPTKLEAGYKKYKCSKCESEYTVELPMLKTGESNVLLVQDRLPWDTSANQTMLRSLTASGYIGGWNVITSSQLSTIDLFNYDLIYIANDQTTSTYNKIKSASDLIANFAENGGAVIYGSCDNGWAGGEISYTLPGEVGKTNYYSHYNYIMDSSSPIVTAELTGGTALTNSLLYSTYSSHTTFTNLPAGANVILTDGKGNPSLVEYDYGEGYVLLSGLTWEYTYVRNMVGSTSFAKCVYDDMIVYALSRVSDSCEHVLDNGFKYPASCGVQGYTLYTCCKCGKVFKKDIISVDHKYGDWIIDEKESCKAEGLKHRKCENCGKVVSEIIPKTENHVPETVKGYAATCTTFGKTDGSICSVCQEVLKEQETISKLEHNYGAWVSNGNGTHTKTCSRDSTHTVTENCSYASGACTVCGAEDYVTPVPAPGNYTISPDGKYIYFGSYPQTKVEDSATVTALNSAAGSLPTSAAFNGWTNYEYYISSSNSTAFMWYKDISYSGEKYRGVYFTQYRPYWCDYSSSSGYTYQDDNGYELSTCYWFKYEPLKWRILTKENGKALLLCDIAIDSQAYQSTYTYDSNTGKYYNNNESAPDGTCANNYEYSTIRAWLNDNFYNTAFTAAQKAIIHTTPVDNSAASTNPNNNDEYWNNGENIYACETTNDKIFLLSEKEITDSSYENGFGFAESPSTYDAARQFKSTDYAKCQGCWASTYSGYEGNCSFWLRSPCYDDSSYAWFVFIDGFSIDFNLVYYTSFGVVPALWLDM